MKKITSALLCAALMLSLACPALAAGQPAELDAASAYVRAEGIMIGDEAGNMRPGDELNRAELAAILARLHGGAHVPAHQYMWACVYSDVPEWAIPYVGYCTANLLVTGYGDGRYGSGDPVLPAAACTVILRACGFGDAEGGDWSYSTACDYALSLGLMDREMAQSTSFTRGDMAILIYRAMQLQNGEVPGPDTGKEPEQPTLPTEPPTLPGDPANVDDGAETPIEQPKNQGSLPDGIVVDADGTILSKTITAAAWSREDFSQQANPAIFTGYYTRAWYNAIRQSIVDRETILAKNDEKNFNPEYLYAHTLTPDQPYDASHAFSDLLGRLGGKVYYSLGAEPYTMNQYEFPGYTIIKVCQSEVMEAPYAFVQPKLTEISGKSDREKLTALNSYLCDLLDYGKGSGGVPAVFSPRSTPALGQCGAYTNAFSFLCDATGIPCINVRSENHAWNEVYVDGQWLTVDVTYNDASMGRDWYLLTECAAASDVCPEGTLFARELMVPGSTK